MVLDLHTKETIENSVLSILNISKDELIYNFYKLYISNDTPKEYILSWIDEKCPNCFLDSVQFYHLTRRLDGARLQESDNLHDLLLSENILSSFLREYDIVFQRCNNHLVLYHRGELQTLESAEEGNVAYLKWRMGYNLDDQDYCVNGFAFRDLLQYNHYYRSLRWCPEFIDQLSMVLQRKELRDDYHRLSKYYCVEYLVPIQNIIVDGLDGLSDQEKSKHLIVSSIDRLYNYWLDVNYNIDDNIILRLNDADTMQELFFVRAEELE